MVRLRSGGLAATAIRHPVGTVMIALATVVLGTFSMSQLSVDLLPKLIYPEIRVRILEPGVSPTVMEDQVTRQLEEQLAITEDAIHVESRTSEGNTMVQLSFPYGKDIDIALRDASTRLDRAKRFLPTTIDRPIIYKLDPSQIPVAEYIVSSELRDPVELRTWTDDIFAKWFLNLPGVAAVEVGGGLVREIHVLPDQRRLAGLGLTMADVTAAIRRGNIDAPAGRVTLPALEFGSRTAGRINSLDELRTLPLRTPDGQRLQLQEVAQVIDAHEDNRLRVRYNGVPGVKITIQKQPDANTVEVVDVVSERLQWLRANKLVPEDVSVDKVSDQSIYVRHSLSNASMAAISGAILAMIVVYLFLGSMKRTLIIGTAIPISIMVTFAIMGASGLTLNIMTLGGLALGVGLLVDNTIVMLENISRHQAQGEDPLNAGVHAAEEVNSAIVASTSTNLAAVLPFLFIGGLTGLIFRELIITISAAILASMVVALTLVPALAARIKRFDGGKMRSVIDRITATMGDAYAHVVSKLMIGWRRSLLLIVAFVAVLFWSLAIFPWDKEVFLPRLDDGLVRINVTVDTGLSIDEMDSKIVKLEELIRAQGYVDGIFTIVGGSVFGRTERETANKTRMDVQLVEQSKRPMDIGQWVADLKKAVAKAQMAGVQVRARPQGVRGLRRASSRSEEEISIRIQGDDLAELRQLGDKVASALTQVKGIHNIENSSEEQRQELAIRIDRDRAADLGVDVQQIGEHVRLALQGTVASDYLDGDRSFDIKVRLPRDEMDDPDALRSILLFPATADRPPIYLRDVADVNMVSVPRELHRDNQRRIVEITANVQQESATLGEVIPKIEQAVAKLEMPPGYTLYFSGAEQSLRQSNTLAAWLIGLALFLVFVVLAVQYESLRNPFIILLCAPFCLIGVAVALNAMGFIMSMPVKLGVIMLIGIVVNNSIVLVEYIEILRERGATLVTAIVEAGRVRLRPILMTTLTTLVGMLPLALGLGEGAEMLQPLAVTMTCGLLFAMFVSLFAVPAMYLLFHRGWTTQAQPSLQPAT